MTGSSRGVWIVMLVAGCNTVLGIHELPAGDAAADSSSLTDAGAQGLVALYHLDTVGSGEHCAIDASGNGHDGSCGDSPPEEIFDGVSGNAAHFASASNPTVHSEGFTVVPAGNLAALPEFTVSVWLRMQLPLVSEYECPLNRVYDSTQADSWEICLGGNGPDGITVFSDENASISGDVGSDTWADGQFHHVGLTYGSTGHTLYFDGALVGSSAGVEFASPNDLISIGRDLDPPSSSGGALVPSAGYQGDLDELRIYNRVLSAQEIMDLVLHPAGA